MSNKEIKTINGNGKSPFNKPISQPRLILVAKDKFQIRRVEQFAKSLHLEFSVYSEEEWATMEEIDQYIQEEELSKQVINLPVGTNDVFSLDNVEAEAIKKVVTKSKGNMMKAARTLKIARATLYRKMQRYGLNLKEQREKQLKKHREEIRKVA